MLLLGGGQCLLLLLDFMCDQIKEPDLSSQVFTQLPYPCSLQSLCPCSLYTKWLCGQQSSWNSQESPLYADYLEMIPKPRPFSPTQPDSFSAGSPCTLCLTHLSQISFFFQLTNSSSPCFSTLVNHFPVTQSLPAPHVPNLQISC